MSDPTTVKAIVPPRAGGSERLVGTATHVCGILDCFSVTSPTLTLTEIAAAIGLRKSSVHRLLRTLVTHRYLSVDLVTHRYRLGERIGNCARVYAASASVASLVRPYLERLRANTNETAALQARTGDRRHVVAQMESRQSIRAVIDLDRAYPLDAGAAGHLLRAFSLEWQSYPDRDKLAGIRRLGYAVTCGEIIEASISIYVPILNRESNAVQFVVGVQAPEFRVSAKVEAILAELRPVARELSDIISPDTPIR